MINLIFVILLLILTCTDIKRYYVPNIVVLPGIALGIYLTGNWLSPIIMFCIGAWLFQTKRIEGGDVKVFAMIGAFIEYKALPMLIIAYTLTYFYRRVYNIRTNLPFMPFLTIASLGFLW